MVYGPRVSTIRFEPLAAQIAKLDVLSELFPPNVVEATRQQSLEEDPNGAPPEDIQLFLAEYMAVASAGRLIRP